MTTHTIRLHRVLRTTPDKIYRAFINADAMAKWMPPHGYTGKVHHVETQAGGTFRMSFTTFATGNSQAWRTTRRARSSKQSEWRSIRCGESGERGNH